MCGHRHQTRVLYARRADRITGILIGWRAVGSQTTDQSRTVAHEIGHILGYGSALFVDGAGGPGNLMAGGGPALTRTQCEAAYAGARSIIGGR